ncbi:hypothetical protein ACFZBP_05510 [Streptomyces sp. NPDC008086]
MVLGAVIVRSLRFNLAGAQIEHVLWIEECWIEKSVDLLTRRPGRSS